MQKAYNLKTVNMLLLDKNTHKSFTMILYLKNCFQAALVVVHVFLQLPALDIEYVNQDL